MDFKIRPIALKDAEGINELRRMPGVFENILGIPSERVGSSEGFISSLDGNQHQFVAVVNTEGKEQVIGSVGLSVNANPRTRHAGGIGIMVHKDYQNAGVGSALMEAIMDIADNWLMLLRVDLTVFTDNDRAIHLYEKMGFVKEGRLRCAGVRGGEYVDEFLMARIRPGSGYDAVK